MNRIHFKINGVDYSAGGEVSSDMTLNQYIRKVVQLHGTKYMCREAGCGACIVTVSKKPGDPPMAVNSCMVTVLSCKDWDITTVEKLGNGLEGYNKLQTTLAENFGSQCGHCTPGFIMNMYSQLKTRGNLTTEEIEKAFGGNICRCTGYRPILDAFKKFAIDAPKDSRLTLDIEDLHICKNNGECNETCPDKDWCMLSQDDVMNVSSVMEIILDDKKKWYRVQTVAEIMKILKTQGTDSYMLLAGNTAKGAAPIEEYPRILIDISDVSELKGYSIHQNLAIGAGVTLTNLLEILEQVTVKDGFAYLRKFVEHINLVAHFAVRNIGTIAGNLMLKYNDNLFTSDIFLLLESVGAQLVIVNSHNMKNTVSMQDFLKLDMKGQVIFQVILPPLSNSYKYVTYKIMPRSQASHAIVNAAFLYKLDSRNIVKECRITYGGLSPNFVRATSTESYLVGKELFKNETLQTALKTLENEMVVVENPPEPSVEHRKMLAINLFYKGLLSLCPSPLLKSNFKSGGSKIHSERPVSTGKQTYSTDKSIWPLNQPLSKLEALVQASGEAPYTDDIPNQPREVFAEFVLSTIGVGKIASIDPRRALKQKGVVAFFSSNDIPGINSFIPAGTQFFTEPEEIFCSGDVKYFNQPIGIIVAESQTIAEKAAKMVDVKYTNVGKPVLDVKIAKRDQNRKQLTMAIDATEQGTDITKEFKNSFTIYGQYHMPMETLACVTIPTEHGMEIHSATQWIDGIQFMAYQALTLDENCFDIQVRRVGGAYGFKISRSIQVAIACALVTQRLRRPCRFMPPLTTNMRAMGKRFPCSLDFEVGVNNSGVIQYLNQNIHEDNGYNYGEHISMFGFDVYCNVYKGSRWNYKCYDTFTDTAKNTWCRSPATLETIAMAEFVMEQLSYELKLDPLEVRLANVDDIKYKDIKEIAATLKQTASYDERRANVDKFNKENRWRKRGLRVSLMQWTPFGQVSLNITVSVYNIDGSVAITHGGVEVGQGINTKAAQICAYFLNIPVSKIKIKPNNSMITPNSTASGGSSTSQYVGIGVQRCCEQLLERLADIRASMNNPTWEALIQKAYLSGVDLQAHAFVGLADINNAVIYGAAIAEVEIDVLTGESEVIRVDLLEDVGRSVSPGIDVGQLEGAFIMGLGYWTSEHLVYSSSGELLTNRTWNYYVPLSRDIPQEFNVSFRENSYSNAAVLGSKMTGEPATCLAVVVPFAIREAIAAARAELGIPFKTWFNIDGPYSVDQILLAISTKKEEFKFT